MNSALLNGRVKLKDGLCSVAMLLCLVPDFRDLYLTEEIIAAVLL